MKAQILQRAPGTGKFQTRKLERTLRKIHWWLGKHTIAGIPRVHLVQQTLQKCHRRERVQRSLHAQLVLLRSQLIQNFVENLLTLAAILVRASQQPDKLVTNLAEVRRRTRLVHGLHALRRRKVLRTVHYVGEGRTRRRSGAIRRLDGQVADKAAGPRREPREINDASPGSDYAGWETSEKSHAYLRISIQALKRRLNRWRRHSVSKAGQNAATSRWVHVR